MSDIERCDMDAERAKVAAAARNEPCRERQLHIFDRLMRDRDEARQQRAGAVGILRELAQMPLRATGKDYDRLVKAARDYLPEYSDPPAGGSRP